MKKAYLLLPDPLDSYATMVIHDPRHYIEMFPQRYLRCALSYIHHNNNADIYLPLAISQETQEIYQRFIAKYSQYSDHIHPLWIPQNPRQHNASYYLFWRNDYDRAAFDPHQYTFEKAIHTEKNDYYAYLQKLPPETANNMKKLLETWYDRITIRNYVTETHYISIKKLIQECSPSSTITIVWLDHTPFLEELGWKEFLHQGQYLSSLSTYLPSGKSFGEKEYENIEIYTKEHTQAWKKVVFKPTLWSWGHGIYIIEQRHGELIWYKENEINKTLSFKNIYHKYSPCVIEEFIDTPKLWTILPNIPQQFFDSPLSLSTHFHEWDVLWNPVIQLTVGWERVWDITLDKSIQKYVDSEFLKLIYTCNTITLQYAEELNLTWPLCLDFLIQKTWTTYKPYLIDPNNRDSWDLALRRIEDTFGTKEKSKILYHFPTTKWKDLSFYEDLLKEHNISYYINFFTKDALSLILAGNSYTQNIEWMKTLLHIL